MENTDRQILDDYRQIPARVREFVETAGPLNDDVRGASQMTLRETVFHLAEANTVSAAMIIAALGSNSASFDWSWLWPNREWVDRMRFAELPVEPALGTLSSTVAHISILVAVRDDAFDRRVMVADTPEADKYPLTIRQILGNEAEHARDHIAELALLRCPS